MWGWGVGALQYDSTEHSRQITKEMQNCVDEKSILAVLEQIHMKVPIEQRKLWETVGDEIKVGVSKKNVNIYSLVRLVVPNTEELISQPFVGGN